MEFFNCNDENARAALGDEPYGVYDDRSEPVPGPGQRSTDCSEVPPLMRSESAVDVLKNN